MNRWLQVLVSAPRSVPHLLVCLMFALLSQTAVAELDCDYFSNGSGGGGGGTEPRPEQVGMTPFVPNQEVCNETRQEHYFDTLLRVADAEMQSALEVDSEFEFSTVQQLSSAASAPSAIEVGESLMLLEVLGWDANARPDMQATGDSVYVVASRLPAGYEIDVLLSRRAEELKLLASFTIPRTGLVGRHELQDLKIGLKWYNGELKLKRRTGFSMTTRIATVKNFGRTPPAQRYGALGVKPLPLAAGSFVKIRTQRNLYKTGPRL